MIWVRQQNHHLNSRVLIGLLAQSWVFGPQTKGRYVHPLDHPDSKKVYVCAEHAWPKLQGPPTDTQNFHFFRCTCMLSTCGYQQMEQMSIHCLLLPPGVD